MEINLASSLIVNIQPDCTKSTYISEEIVLMIKEIMFRKFNNGSYTVFFLNWFQNVHLKNVANANAWEIYP